MLGLGPQTCMEEEKGLHTSPGVSHVGWVLSPCRRVPQRLGLAAKLLVSRFLGI